MGESLRIDPTLVHALVTELTAVAESAQRDLTELTDALDHEGKPWGDDEPGRMVGDSYEPQAKKGLEGYQNLVENLRTLSKGVADIADAFRDQDQELGRQIRTIGETGIGADQPVRSGSDQVWPSTDTPTNVSPTGSGANADNKNGTPSDGGPPNSATQANGAPSGYPLPAATGDTPVGGPTRTDQQPAYPDSSTPRDSTQQPSDTSTEGDANTAASPVAGNSPPTSTGTNPPTATGTPRTGDPAAGKPAGTPWSRTPFPSGTPWSGTRTGARPPGQVFAPPPGRAGKPTQPKREDKPRKKKRGSPAYASVPTDAAALAAAQDLADRHGLRIVGFDTSGIGREMVAQLASAVDRVLGRYPFIELGGIEITELGDGRISRVTRDRGDDGSESARTGSWILLDRALVSNPAQFGEKVHAAIQSGNFVTGSEERPMFSTIVGDLGRIMAGQVDRSIWRLAQRSLINEYRRINGPWDAEDTLARIVGGYRQWRDQLGGNSIVDGRFQPQTALAAAFAEVELRGDDACGPARVLYRLLVEGLRGRSTPQ